MTKSKLAGLVGMTLGWLLLAGITVNVWLVAHPRIVTETEIVTIVEMGESYATYVYADLYADSLNASWKTYPASYDSLYVWRYR